jgi:hypothetical protein
VKLRISVSFHRPLFAWVDETLFDTEVSIACILFAFAFAGPFIDLILDENLFDENLNRRPSPNSTYVKTVLAKAAGRAYQQCGNLLLGFMRGFKIRRWVPGTLIGLTAIVAIIRREPEYTVSLFSVEILLSCLVGVNTDISHETNFIPKAFAFIRSISATAAERQLSPVGTDKKVTRQIFIYSAVGAASCGVLSASSMQAKIIVLSDIVVIGYMVVCVCRKWSGDVQRSNEERLVLHTPPGITPMWVSERTTFGSANHQILIVGNNPSAKKYELKLINGAAADPSYESTPFHIKHEDRLGALRTNGWSLGMHYLYLIGWTDQPHDKIDRICNDLIATWVYDQRTRNCQHFIRAVAKQIVIRKAMEWDHFETRKVTPLLSGFYVTYLIYPMGLSLFWLLTRAPNVKRLYYPVAAASG